MESQLQARVANLLTLQGTWGPPMNQVHGPPNRTSKNMSRSCHSKCFLQSTELEVADFLDLSLIFASFWLVVGMARENLVSRQGSDFVGCSLCDC